MNFKTKNIASPKLSIQKLARVQKIFEDKNWPIEDFLEMLFLIIYVINLLDSPMNSAI